MCNLINTHKHTRARTHTYTHIHTLPPREDQCEWHRMTRMTGPDCVVMCNLINTHTHTHNHGICGVPGGFARRHDGGPPVEGNLRQEPGVA